MRVLGQFVGEVDPLPGNFFDLESDGQAVVVLMLPSWLNLHSELVAVTADNGRHVVLAEVAVSGQV